MTDITFYDPVRKIDDPERLITIELEDLNAIYGEDAFNGENTIDEPFKLGIDKDIRDAASIMLDEGGKCWIKFEIAGEHTGLIELSRTDLDGVAYIYIWRQLDAFQWDDGAVPEYTAEECLYTFDTDEVSDPEI